MDKKRIVLSGYYGYDNAGDEAVLVSILQKLRKNNFEPIVLSGNPEKTKKLYNVEAVHRMDFGAMNQAIMNADGLISGGGSLLQDVTSPKTIPYYLAVLKLAQTYKKPTFFYSQGVGPVNRKLFFPFLRFVLNGCTYLSVRDIESKRFLESIKIKNVVDLSIDPVLAIEKTEVTLSKNLSDFMDNKPVLISLRKWKSDENVISETKKLVKELISQNHHVLFVPFHHPHDLEISEAVASEFNDSPLVHVQKDELTVEEVVNVVSKSKLVIGMRLHSLIMAASQHVPFVGISYDPKIDELLSQFELKAATTTEQYRHEDILHETNRILSSFDDEVERISQLHANSLHKISLPIEAIVRHFEVNVNE